MLAEKLSACAHLPDCGKQSASPISTCDRHLHAEQSYGRVLLLRWVPMFQTERIGRRVLKCACRAVPGRSHRFQRASRRIAHLFLPLLCVPPVAVPPGLLSRQIVGRCWQCPPMSRSIPGRPCKLGAIRSLSRREHYERVGFAILSAEMPTIHVVH